MQAVILAGGLGVRLRPFTEVIPKPLLPVGEKSLLEIQITRLRQYGFDEIFLCTNYKSEYIENFFGDGHRLGVNLYISKEEDPLGTCGPLKLLQDRLRDPFLVMNGDILTTADFGAIYRFGLTAQSDFTVVTKEIMYPFEFGNVIAEGDYIREIQEKPKLRIEIIAGVYVGKPAVLELIPKDTYYGMDHLIQRMLADGRPVAKYLLQDYWLDIGRIEDYREAEDAYNNHFKKASPGEPR